MDVKTANLLACMADEIISEFGCSRCIYKMGEKCDASLVERAKFIDIFCNSEACLYGTIHYYKEQLKR